MGFNGIEGAINVPGQIPWEIVVIYFIVAIFLAFYLGKRTGGLKAFTTVDLVYIGIGGAFSVVWEFYVGGFIGRFLPSTAFISVGFWGRLIIVFIIAALVRKVGAGMLTLFVYNLLGDLFHYGFGGEPMYFIYETLTYGLFVDLMIAATGGHIFGIGKELRNGGGGGRTAVKGATLLAVAQGALLGFSWAIPDPIFYSAFFSPFLYGSYVNWAHVLFNLGAFIPGDVVMGIIGGLLAIRVVRAVGQ
ncbi:hypothetical protein [Metallosphaera javensis (ex Sakai et al. 2022)]|uniref:hypothetical protein n=1 Tax=Metallosphaera javensis (ex Sakai et al. 2022) TaxID=2775498 RepID=UPI00258FDFC9|nr:MAG: substrate-specific component ST1137 of predicted ECF transporter [Metallosphaera javensis (ex Sakai et al. 2022)]